MRIIFHLGTHKTGTTTIQNSLFENRDALLKEGILFPLTGTSNEKGLGHRHAPLTLGYLNGRRDACPVELLEELKASNAHTAIFSYEAWSNLARFPHLKELIKILRENGYNDFTGVLALRNLVDFQVSCFREFTINRGNCDPYWQVVKTDLGLFDYPRLAAACRALFGDKFIALPFDGSPDISRDFFVAIGLEDAFETFTKVARGNVKSVTALDVEAMRCANGLGMSKQNALAALSSVMAGEGDIAAKDWTERFVGDGPTWSTEQRQVLRECLHWSDEDFDALLACPDPEGRDVREMTQAITSKLEARPLKKILKVVRAVLRRLT